MHSSKTPAPYGWIRFRWESSGGAVVALVPWDEPSER
jgi:hypothetical protein